MIRIALLSALCVCALGLSAQKTYTVKSPDGTVATTISAGNTLTYSISVDNNTVLKPSAVSMTLSTKAIWGENVKVKKAVRTSVNTTVASPLYRATEMRDCYNAITLQCQGSYDVEFRTYNDGVAYRFVSHINKPYNVVSEGVEYRLTGDNTCTVPYVRNFDPQNPQKQFFNSFENTYTIAPISQLNKQRYCFLPLVAEAGNGVKLGFTESHLEDYPGLYLHADEGNTLRGINAPYPKEVKQGGHNNLQMLVITAENDIAKVDKARSFPWRIAMIARHDSDLAANNLSYLLGAPCRLADFSWVKPGKVAWEWWNDWNIAGVDFKSGVNNATYKHYIDFANEHGIEYVILDEGWAVNKAADLMQVVPEIDLQELVDYGAKKNVGIILWAGYWAFERDMENVCRHYSEMGVKGFKVDFMDRDDQIIADFYYRAAATCAKYHMLIDFHGAFKPAGLNRTYPNAINFEGVFGLENMKWIGGEHDQMTYDCQIPFLRQASGPHDYTQGAMINAIRQDYRPNNALPMSQGTRCHQLGMYMVFDSPLSMLCDSPTNYRFLGGKCTQFIAEVPTVWDETKVLDGEIGKYIITARRKGNVWYVGGITNWDARDITVNTSALGNNAWTMELFADGANATHRADDYRYTTGTDVAAGKTITIHMAPGGGFAMKLIKK